MGNLNTMWEDAMNKAVGQGSIGRPISTMPSEADKDRQSILKEAREKKSARMQGRANIGIPQSPRLPTIDNSLTIGAKPVEVDLTAPDNTIWTLQISSSQSYSAFSKSAQPLEYRVSIYPKGSNADERLNQNMKNSPVKIFFESPTVITTPDGKEVVLIWNKDESIISWKFIEKEVKVQ